MELQHVDIYKEAKTLFLLDNQAFSRDFDWPAQAIQDEIDFLKGSQVYILYDKKEPVGFFAYQKDAEGYEVKTIAVTPTKQGKGYGKFMMEKVLKLTAGDPLHLVTHPKNSSAIIFYLKSGFKIVGWKDNYYGDGEPRLLLKRNG